MARVAGTKVCEVCNALFRCKPSQMERRSCCSRSCQKLNAIQKGLFAGKNNGRWKGCYEFDCHYCGKRSNTIPARSASAKFCNRNCKARYQSQNKTGENAPQWKGGALASYRRYASKIGVKRKERIARLCKICNREGLRKSATMHSECRPKPKSGVYLMQCLDCGTIKKVNNKPGQQRCFGCAARYKSGCNNHNWKGGVTPERKRIRNTKEYKEWRTAIFLRDNYTCVWCGQVGGDLNADHIKPFARFPDLRFDINNGRTLCVSCHKRTDSYLSKGRRKVVA